MRLTINYHNYFILGPELAVFTCFLIAILRCEVYAVRVLIVSKPSSSVVFMKLGWLF